MRLEPRRIVLVSAMLMSPALASGASVAAAAPPELAPATPAGAPVAEGAAPVGGEVDAAAPEDLTVVVTRELTTGGVVLRARRPGYVVALRGAEARVVAGEEATMHVPCAESDGTPIFWETTQIDTLETTRGVLRVRGERAQVVVTDAPVPVPVEVAAPHPHHDCRAQDDGMGGLTLLCRITRAANAASLSGAEVPDTWVASVAERSVVRMDFVLCPGSVDARVFGYFDDGKAVVVRVEGSFLPGETGPSLAVLAAERVQPAVQRRFFRHGPRF
jgi:hypothetical protein